ncbi:MAG: PilZ domain-containing protein [Gammaproteobacteria bacterium]|nr:PilZ domain-containing protein [Gammaproteobacteria bacterium]
MQDNKTFRKYIRHPADVPIYVLSDLVEDEDESEETLTNISLGGLSFISSQALDVLHKVRVCIPLIKQSNYLEGRIVWCEKVESGYEIGLQFDRSNEVFRLRMIEQICHIEHYRKDVEHREGRKLSNEEAAKEWISLYAGDFPAL